MKNIKRLLAILTLFVFTVVGVAGCTSSPPANEANSEQSETQESPDTTEASEPAEPAEPTEESGSDVDISEHVDLVMYLIGDKAPDHDRIYVEINKLAEKELNATVTCDYIGWADRATKYSLILSSGENVDLMFTADWCYYSQEALKGAFLEITDEMIQKYMPLTWETQDKVSYNHARINGKLYAIPCNLSLYTGMGTTGIRGDLREKYNIPPLKTFEDYENYVLTIAKNEKGIEAFAAYQTDSGLKGQGLFQPNNYIPINSGSFVYVYNYKDDANFTADKAVYNYFLPEYADWAKRMKTWADAGVWSRNAISNNTATQQAFENGKSASLIINFYTVINSIEAINETHPEWKPELYDLAPDSVKYSALYSNNMMAVPYVSKNPERALMLLDKLKMDKRYYDLMQYGIEGEHWIAHGDDKWEAGPKYNDYKQGGHGQWGCEGANLWRDEVGKNPLEDEFTALFDKNKVNPITQGFKFDETPVKSELAAIRSLEQKHGYLLDLGLVDDVDKALAEFKDALMAAGFEKVDTEFRKQLTDYLATVKK